jgi:cobalt-zinc-cadmium efflux system membrane fusion protein
MPLEDRTMKRIVAVALVGAVVVALAGLGLAAVRPDLMPSWARLRGTPPASADAGLMCAEHGVPERFCTLCHEDLKARLILCAEHGDIPEEICTLCHPEVREKYHLAMCPEGHGLPAQFCGECAKKKGPAAAADLVDDGWCAAHDQPEETCIACGPGSVPDPKDGCRQGLPLVRLASARTAGQIGLETAPTTRQRHGHRLVGNAEILYNANLYAEVRPRVAGLVREIQTDEGVAERRGDVLAVIDSAEVGAAKARYLGVLPDVELARSTLDRTVTLVSRGAAPQKNELEARAALNRARAGLLDAQQRLLNLGFTDADLAELTRTQDTTSLLKVVAPIDGTVISRHCVRGEAVEPSSQLFVVADTGAMWAWIDIDESEVSQVEAGQDVTFTITGTDAPAFTGHVEWIAPEVNPATRTIRVRAMLDNVNGRLRANQFGRAEIAVGDEHDTVFVPRAAVQTFGKAHLVFLPQDGGRFRPQRVVTRRTESPEEVEVDWGLRPGQTVVTTGSFLLKTEILKDAIGQGCCK